MGNNPFISHRMFVAALNQDATPSSASTAATRAHEERAKSVALNLSPEQLAALAAKHWLDFPFARGMQQTAT